MPPKRKTPKREGSSSGLPRPAFDPSDLSDAARREVVRSDGARKRAARVFTNNNLPVPPKYFYRALPEFDRLCAIARRGEGSSSGAGSSSAGSSSAGSSSRAVVRTEPHKEAPLPEYDPAAFRRALSELDLSPTTRSMPSWRCCDLEAQGRQQAEVNDVLLEKGIAASLEEPFYIGSSDEE